MTTKVYCGKWKIISWQYWDFTKLNLKLEELEKYTNEKWYVNVLVNDLREPDNYWNTLTVTIDSYKPENKTNNIISKSKQAIDIEDVPF